jgi:hypothetical protein
MRIGRLFRSAKEISTSQAIRPTTQLVVEHADGFLEEVGVVEFYVQAGRKGMNRSGVEVAWKSVRCARKGATVVDASEITPRGFRRPIEVNMRDGERQYWYFGEHAVARMKAERFRLQRRDHRSLVN